jgi:predicted O-methyltransferase YrrM
MPLPSPRYLQETPAIDDGGKGLYYRLTAETLGTAALAPEAKDFVLDVIGRLTPIDELEVLRAKMRAGLEKFGTHWRYANLHTVLSTASYFLQPAEYLEIGVRRGYSAAVVAAMCPSSNIYGFDLWVEDYVDVPNPGPDFVRKELANVGHEGTTTLVSGDSKATVPQFLAEHPDLFFDMVTVDGVKSLRGAASDFVHTLPRLKIGGVAVYDDLPVKPLLRRVWNRMVRDDHRFVTWEFLDGDLGVAAAIRVKE